MGPGPPTLAAQSPESSSGTLSPESPVRGLEASAEGGCREEGTLWSLTAAGFTMTVL